jgi:transposase, IS30 family
MKNKHLTSEERNPIEVLLQTKTPVKIIAQLLDKDKSTIYREINRNKTKRGSYSANFAQQLATERKERFGRPRKFTAKVQKFVVEKLTKEQWSPEQIAGFAELNKLPLVSHELIYSFV